MLVSKYELRLIIDNYSGLEEFFLLLYLQNKYEHSASLGTYKCIYHVAPEYFFRMFLKIR